MAHSAPYEDQTDDRLREAVAAYQDCGLNTSRAARQAGVHRATMQHRLRKARELGMLEPGPDENAPANHDSIMAARLRKIQEFQKKQRKGSWDKPVAIGLPARPFRLKLFGDPHMDSNAFDLELWEHHWMEVDAADGVYGVCIGDWFNNWLRVLGHLWKHEGDPDDAWVLFEHYMNERGGALLAACSGNHDDWTHGPVDPIDLTMKRHGVVYRKGAVRVILQCGSDAVSIALRHKWKGHSMYSPAHGLRRAAAEGWLDDVMVGGHIHQDEDRQYVQPRSRHIAHLFQLSAFKRFDDYPDIHGMMPQATDPVRDLVIDPRRSKTDPDRVKSFHDAEAAAAHLEWVRCR